MNKERLLKLADLLEANAANPKDMKFDLNTVAQRAGDEPAGLDQIGVDCNTAGCAIGLAALIKAFEEDGLAYKYVPEWEELDLYCKSIGFLRVAKRIRRYVESNGREFPKHED